MMNSSESAPVAEKYFVDTEGTLHPWPTETITTEQIISLGGWDPSQGVVEIDKDNNQHTLQPGEIVHLKPGHGFAKKVKFKRGQRARAHNPGV